jgi:hypothetical protein
VIDEIDKAIKLIKSLKGSDEWCFVYII